MADEKIKNGLGRGLISLFGDQVEEVSIKRDSESPYLLVSISD